MLNDGQQKKRFIAGPCAFESRETLRNSIKFLKGLGIKIVRSSLWKPRTRPGWDGIGADGVDILLEEAIAENMTPATEILTAEHAQAVIDGLSKINSDADVLLWLGARNQSHFEQRKIGKLLAKGPKNIYLMFKNQMWEDLAHWVGIGEHLLESGFPKERLIACHRGFSPGKAENPHQLRNIPDFEMSMTVKEKLEIPMFFDPSHTGGSPEKVFLMLEMSLNYNYDGYLIEVHPDRKVAKTDGAQQLSHEEFEGILKKFDLQVLITH